MKASELDKAHAEFRDTLRAAYSKLSAVYEELAAQYHEGWLDEEIPGLSEEINEIGELEQQLSLRKQRLDWDSKISRMKYTAVRLVLSKEYRETDEQRTRAAAIEAANTLAIQYFPGMSEEQFNRLFEQYLKQHLEAAIQERSNGDKRPVRMRSKKGRK